MIEKLQIPALDQVTKNPEQTGSYVPVANLLVVKQDGEGTKHHFVKKTITNKLGQKKHIYVKTEKKE